MKKILIIFSLCLFCFFNSISLALDIEKLSDSELDSLFETLYMQGKHQEGANYAKMGREVSRVKFGEMDTTYSNFTGCLANFYQALGRYEEAEVLYHEALNISAHFFDRTHIDRLMLLSNLAHLYMLTSRYEEAEQLFLEVLKVNAQVLGKDHLHYGLVLLNLAQLYYYMDRLKEAETKNLEALKIFKKTTGEEHYYYSAALNNLALIYDKLKQYKKAESYYLKAIFLKKKNAVLNLTNYAGSLNNLAVLYDRMGNYKKAKKLYLDAYNIRAQVWENSHPDFPHTLNYLAILSKKLGHEQQAWEYAHQAISSISQLELSRTINNTWANQLKNMSFPSSRHIERAEEILNGIDFLLDHENNTQNKEKLKLVADVAMHILNNSRDNFINDQDKLRLLAKSQKWMFRSLSYLELNKNFDHAFSHVEIHKSTLLMEATITTKSYKLGYLPDSLFQKEKQMKRSHHDLQAELLKKRPELEKDSIRTKLNKLNLQISTFKKLVENQYPKYAKLHYQSYQSNVAEVQRSLQNHEAIIEYVLGDSHLFLIYIDNKKAFIKKRDLDQDFHKKINDYRKRLSQFEILDKQRNKMADLYHQGHWFYKQLLAPLKEVINDKEHLIIIPDGELYHLPFEAFVSSLPSNDHNVRYIIQDFEISYNYSASLWVENLKISQNPRHNGELFAMAANYKNNHLNVDQSLPLRAKRRKELGYLPAAREELVSLANSFNGYFAYDSLASERIFKEKAGDYAVIHLAMHGMLDEKFPTLSSLAFTDTDDRTENDFLQAYEISKMELHAELAVLSACETGFGKFERGNGVASLARAFMYAGVPSLVVSLWQVDDQATSKIMKEFYNGLAKGLSKSEALRQAKLWYINNAQEAMKHPAYWSPFIQIGNSKPIKIQRKYAYTPWYVGLAVMCLIAGLVFWNRKRIF